jgi:ABC-type dipeptide/oligopeptide/nickel transport system ATPase subunit
MGLSCAASKPCSSGLATTTLLPSSLLPSSLLPSSLLPSSLLPSSLLPSSLLPPLMNAVQFDTLVDTLTCREMLLYTAQLKRPRHEPLSEKQQAVEQLLDKLGLSSCSSTQIGHTLKRGISGGQAKRLNIGVALISDPRVLYLDEVRGAVVRCGM